MNDLITFLIKKLSQVNMNQNTPPMDPNAIQQGQTIYDEAGSPFTVAENDPMRPDMVLVPEGQGPTTGVETVENQEISNRFTVQDNLDPSNPDPNINASVDSSFKREKSTLALISKQEIKAITPFEISQQNHKVSQDLDLSFNTPSLDLRVDFPEFNQDPQSGYSEIKNFVTKLVSEGYSDTDIILMVGEEFEKTFAERVLTDLRDRGVF